MKKKPWHRLVAEDVAAAVVALKARPQKKQQKVSRENKNRSDISHIV